MGCSSVVESLPSIPKALEKKEKVIKAASVSKQQEITLTMKVALTWVGSLAFRLPDLES
jgi:hypothetical protein